MASTKDNDKRIKELKAQIQTKLENMPKISKDFNTNLVLDFHDKQYNLNVISKTTLQDLQIQLYLYQVAIDALHTTAFQISGYMVKDWLHDIQKLIDIQDTNITVKELKSSLTKLETMLSDTAKTEEFLDDLEDLLKG